MFTKVDPSNEKLWEHYFKYGERIFTKGNTTIYTQGLIGDGFYFLQKGLVKIVTTNSNGMERILHIEGAGQVFGEQAFDKKPYFSSAVTVMDSVLYYFSCKRFNELIVSDHELLNLVLNAAIQKVQILADDIMLKSIPAEKQIAIMLLKIMHTSNDDRIYLTQQELSKYTGLTRITVYKTLKKWKEEGLIEVKNRMIIIKQPDKLKQPLIC